MQGARADRGGSRDGQRGCRVSGGWRWRGGGRTAANRTRVKGPQAAAAAAAHEEEEPQTDAEGVQYVWVAAYKRRHTCSCCLWHAQPLQMTSS